MAKYTVIAAGRHTKMAKSAVAKRQWRDVANSVMKRTHDVGRAISAANAVVKKRMAVKKK
jgi:hypothetical protein